MNRCRTCGSPRSDRRCPRCAAGGREPPVLTDGGERDPDDGEEAEHREGHERWNPETRRDEAAEDSSETGRRREGSDRRSRDGRPRREPDDRRRDQPPGERERREPPDRGSSRPPRQGDESPRNAEPGDRQSRERSPNERGSRQPGHRERRSQGPPGGGRDRQPHSRDGERSRGQGDRRPPEHEQPPRDRGRRRGGQPRDRGGGRTPRSGQRPRDTAPPGQSGDGHQQPSGGDDAGGPRLGRREFLLGGAGAAGLAAGGWWFFLRGYDGAKGVVAEYLDALDGNDWGAAGGLYHSDSEFGRLSADGQVDGYEAYLTDSLVQRWEATTVDIDELYETNQVENVEQNEGFRGFDPAEHDVTEFKEILAVVSEDRTGWDGLGPDQDAKRKTTYRYTTARPSSGGWALWWARR